jgi:hypothetical protein
MKDMGKHSEEGTEADLSGQEKDLGEGEGHS